MEAISNTPTNIPLSESRGNSYHEAAALSAVTTAISNNKESAQLIIDLKNSACPQAVDLTHPRFANPIALHRLTPAERKLLERLAQAKLKTARACDVLGLDVKTAIKRIRGSSKSQKTLLALKRKLITDPHTCRKFAGEISFVTMQRDLLDIIDYINALPPAERTYMRQTLYLDEPKVMLRELAAEMGLSQAGARFLRNRHLEQVRLIFTHPLDEYRRFLMGKGTALLTAELFDVYNLFRSERLYAFLEEIVAFEKNALLKRFTIGHLNLQNCLDKIFAVIDLPCPLEMLRAALEDRFNLTDNQIEQFISKAKLEGLLHCNTDEVMMAKLSPKAAIAQVLLKYPQGLHWSKLVQIINNRGMSTKPLIEYRELRIPLYLHDVVMRCQQATYRHTQFTNLTPQLIEEVLSRVKAYLTRMPVEEISLSELIKELGLTGRLDRYELRHIVSIALPKHFFGRSNRDVICRTPRTDSPKLKIKIPRKQLCDSSSELH